MLLGGSIEVTKKYTLKTVNTMIKDESEAVKDYCKKGLPKFAAEEHKHLQYWMQQKKKIAK